MRIYPVLAIGVIVALTAAGAEPIVRAAQRERVERHVFVGVVNAKGEPAQGLAAADFVVREDDVAREVLRVSPTSQPTHVALLIDDTQEFNRVLVDMRSALDKFVVGMSGLPTPPSMTLVTMAERPTIAVPWTSSDIAVGRGIQRIIPRPGSGSYLQDAIMETCQALRKQGAAQPVIVAFVMDSSAALSDLLHTRVADGLKEASASLWTVQLQRNTPQGSTGERERARVIGDVTTWSGGMNVPVLSPAGLEKAFATLSASILNRYDVTYGRPETLIPPSKLSIEVRDRSLRVTAPRWTSR